MISIKKILTAVTTAFALTMLSSAVLAQDTAPKKGEPGTEKMHKMERMERMEGHREMRGPHGMHRGGIVRGLHRLDLTDAQKTQIKSLMETHRATNKPVMEEAHSLMMKRREGTLTDADKARLEEIHASMMASREQLRSTILGLLTPEQTQKLEQMKSEREERMEHRKERMMERKQRMEQKLQEKKEAPPVDQ